MSNEIENLIIDIITNSGSAKSSAFEALEYAKNNELDKAREKIKESGQELLKAHHVQTSLLQKEATGKDIKLNLLTVHAQDHLMTSMLAKDLIEEMIDMQIELNKMKSTQIV